MSNIELSPEPKSRRGLARAGLTLTQRRWFDRSIIAVVLLFAAGWTAAVVHAVRTGAPRPGIAARMTANPLSSEAPAPAVYLLDAALERIAEETGYGGISGQVRVVVREPGQPLPLADSLQVDSADGDAVDIAFAPIADSATATPAEDPSTPGIWNVLVRAAGVVRRVPDLHVLSMVPLTEKRGGRIGSYLVGSWPNESGGTPRSEAYRPPRGMIRVMPGDVELPVSRHFKLGDFLTKGQDNVWPKYVLLSPRLLDKLELTIDELERSGTPVEHVGVISGFRTPSYNAGGGNTSGRGSLSRHMYGDAMDWYVDNDRDGRMDDLNGDGRIDRGDGRVIVEAAERVERRYPELIGGIGLYNPTGAHSGFVHIDTRGYRARW